ncbi:hypothetical protein KJ909_04005 [Patescibacteria group bacterium]|nr:hypothetical protein [Patescibacteria group bacterium]
MKRGTKVTEELIEKGLAKREGRTDVEIAEKVGLSPWKKKEVRAVLETMAKRGQVVKQNRKTDFGRPPVEFRKA